MYKNSILVADLLKNERHITKLMRGGKCIYYPLQEHKEEEPPEPSIKARLTLTNDTVVEIPFVDENDHTLYSTETSAYQGTCVEAEVFDGVTTLDRTFNGFSAMTSATITDDVTTIVGANMLCDCHVLKRVNSNSDGVFNLPKNISGSLNDGAVARCYEMETVVIPSGVTSIGNAFAQCNRGVAGKLKYIFAQPLTAPTITNNTFNDTPTGGTLFHYCDTPNYSTWMQNANYYLGKYGWNSKSVSREPMMKVTLNSGDEVEGYGSCDGIIGETFNTSVFYKTATTAVEVYDNVHTIDGGGFSGRTSMTSITLPDSVTSIGQTAFQGCSVLSNIRIPTGLTSIGYGCFVSCSGLTSFELPATLTSIGDRSFDNTPAMTALTCNATTPPTFTRPSGTMLGLFNGNCGIQHIYVPASSVDAYKAATGWKINADIIEAIP